jgi:hypothetical protein
VIVVIEFSSLRFVSLGDPELSAASEAKGKRGSAPAATIAVLPVKNSRRVGPAIEETPNVSL